MFVASGAQYHLSDGMVQATYSACPPFSGYAPFNPARNDANLLSKYCIAFNDGVEKFAIQSESVRTIILAASFGQYTVPGYKMVRRSEDGDLVVESSALTVTERIFAKLIRRLEVAGKKVIVVAPPPGVENDYLVCDEKLLTGKLAFDSNLKCGHSAVSFRENTSTIGQLMEVASKAGADVVMLSDAICDERVCRTVIDGTLLYRDEGHLTYEGAKKVFAILGEEGKLPPPFQ
jgi:hypothetical protein